jgi:hypothetical protein
MRRHTMRRGCLHGSDPRICESCGVARWRLTLATTRAIKLASAITPHAERSAWEKLRRRLDAAFVARGSLSACVRPWSAP